MICYGAPTLENGAEEAYDSCFHPENESSMGKIALYRVFPGIELICNDMRMAYCSKNQQPVPNVMETNYCKEGRSECLFGANQYLCMSGGDLSFCSLHDSAHQSEFPTAHYHGITVTIDLAAITEEIRRVLGQHRAIRQEVSDRIFAPIQSLENEGILYVFLFFQTEEVGQKDGGDSQTQLRGVALAACLFKTCKKS